MKLARCLKRTSTLAISKSGKVFHRTGVCSLVTFVASLGQRRKPMISRVAQRNGMETIRDNGHSDRVIRKCERIVGLKALIKEWELSDNPDLNYIRGLKVRLLSVKNQLKNMCGHDGSEGMDDW
jgi:hypothetical protein